MSKPLDGNNPNGILADFGEWARSRVAENAVSSQSEIDDLLAKFLASRGIDNPKAYLGNIEDLKTGQFHQAIVDEFEKLGARVKSRRDEQGADVLERYRGVPLHAIFLYTTEDSHVADYILDNWGALDTLSGEFCDVHPTVDQFESKEDAYDFVDKLDVVRDADFRALSELPGLFVWSLNAESEFVSFGTNASQDEIRNTLRLIFEEVRNAPVIASVSKAKAKLTSSADNDQQHSTLTVIGDLSVSQDHIHIENVVGPVNVKARLDNVTQVVKNAPSVPEPQKEELTKLLEQLKSALEPAATKQAEDSERVIEAAEMVAKEVAKEKPSKSFLNITTEGLKEAAKAVQEIAPTVLKVATNIATYVASMF